MNTELVETKYYKTIIRRIFASYIDMIVCCYISVLIYISLRFLVVIPISNITLFNTISFITTYLYLIITAKKLSGSFGKLYFNLQIVQNKDETNITWKQSIKRELINIIFAVFNLAPLFIYTLTNKINTYEDMKKYQSQDLTIHILSFVYIFIFLLEILSSLFSRKRRAIHDFIGGTVIKITGKYYFLSKTITVILGTLLFIIYLSFFTHVVLK